MVCAHSGASASRAASRMSLHRLVHLPDRRSPRRVRPEARASGAGVYLRPSTNIISTLVRSSKMSPRVTTRLAILPFSMQPRRFGHAVDLGGRKRQGAQRVFAREPGVDGLLHGALQVARLRRGRRNRTRISRRPSAARRARGRPCRGFRACACCRRSSGSASRAVSGQLHAEQDGRVEFLQQRGGFGTEGFAAAIEDRRAASTRPRSAACGRSRPARLAGSRMRGESSTPSSARSYSGRCHAARVLRVGVLDQLVVRGIEIDLADVGDVAHERTLGKPRPCRRRAAAPSEMYWPDGRSDDISPGFSPVTRSITAPCPAKMPRVGKVTRGGEAGAAHGFDAAIGG